MPLPNLERFLAAQGGLKPVVEKALRIDALAKRCAAFLPPELAAQVRVANLRQNQLVLLASNPAAAAKLRLYAESLAAFLSTPQSDGIVVSVKVQPNLSREKHGAAHKKPALSSAALEELSSLYRRLRDSPVRQALGALLKHHGVPPTPPPASARTGTAATPRPRQTRRT